MQSVRFLIAGALSLVGCGQLLGLDEYGAGGPINRPLQDAAGTSCVTGSTSGAVYNGKFRYESRECGECAVGRCAVESEACYGDPACSEFAQCLALCKPCDHACRGRCTGVAGAYSSPETTALQRCEAAQCGDLCNGLLVRFEDCDRCLDEQCHDDLVSASTGVGDDGLTACQSGVGPCRSRCSAQVVDLGCLDAVVWPKDPDAPMLTLRVSAVDAIGGVTSVQGLSLHSCWEGGPDCARGPSGTTAAIPVALAFSQRDPNSGEFLGHLLAEDPNDAYLKHLLYVFPSPSKPEVSLSARLWNRSDLTNRLAVGEVVQDPSNGAIFLDVLDCRGVEVGAHVPGVTISIDRVGSTTGSPPPTPNLFYGYPLVLDPAGHTDANGLALIANVRPNLYTVTATVEGKLLGAVKVWVEPDTVTSFHLVPTPQGN